MIGTTLSHFRIAAKLGQGGMGQVYRAKDTKLGREVAIKVLPSEMADDRERLERFKRDAKSVAALNHPNIVTIYSVEDEVGDLPFITMELVTGKTLAELLPDQGYPLEEFLEIAVPLADAIAAAHEQGIVHRDLRPANVMLTCDGRLKVLDFGLAKLVESEPYNTPDERAKATAPTQHGLDMDTVSYMSPEQIDGKPVGSRTDVFALGIMLYEMLVGERPFTGDAQPALMSAILKDTPPPITKVRNELPDGLAQTLGRCLEKDLEKRFPSARETHAELDTLRKRIATGTLG